MDGNLTVRRYTTTVANLNVAPAPTNANTIVTLTLPNSIPTAEVTAGAGGFAVGVSNANGLVCGPVIVTNANTAKFSVLNSTNNAIAAVNATFQIYLVEPTGSSSGVATAAVS